MSPWPRKKSPWLHWNEPLLRRNIGIYLHIPFCLHRCSYCDFLTYGDKRPAGLTPPAYVEALLEEIARRGEWWRRHYLPQGRLVDSVFFGGGTPTYLPAEDTARLVRAVYGAFSVGGGLDRPISVQNVSSTAAGGSRPAPTLEFTTEANPDTLTPDYIAALAEAGVNRISIGIQATQTKHLRRMQRTHRWEDIRPRLRWVAEGPIPRFSFDLIYGLPYMRVGEVRETLARLLDFNPRHISAYELIYEPGTPLYAWSRRFSGQRLDEQSCLQQHRAIELTLRGRGLYRYEISNYALPGEESRHNLRYWRGGDYIGLGIGAASRVGIEVINNPRAFELYRKDLAGIGGEGDALERTVGAGLDPPMMSRRAGHDPPLQAPAADIFMQMRTRLGTRLNGHRIDPRWITDGLLRVESGQIVVTSKGLAFADMFHKAWV
ncbi:coproporphyrinogen III oxidase family protein [bacterium]|nr:coproporphyrinogen III oxidase family protein [bacterium]